MLKPQASGRKPGFTLVELLVVVAIIIVLLAMLLPAMDKAIYQAALVQCSTTQRSVTSSVIQYCFDHKRYYPRRGVFDQEADQEGMNFLNPMQVANPARGYDVRPPLKGYVQSINKQLQCPLIEPAEMENETPGNNIESSYMMLWGWVYKVEGETERGMFKMGDRFTWTERSGSSKGDVSAYNVLLCDMDVRYNNAFMQAAHPDRGPRMMQPFIWKDYFGFGRNWNLTRWSTPQGQRVRGLLDDNFAYDDGSVHRYNDVRGWFGTPRDERMDDIPLEYDRQNANNWFHVPKQ